MSVAATEGSSMSGVFEDRRGSGVARRSILKGAALVAGAQGAMAGPAGWYMTLYYSSSTRTDTSTQRIPDVLP